MYMLGEDVQSISLDTETLDRARRIRTIVLSVGAVLLIGGISAAGYYFYSQYQRTQFLLKNPQAAAKQEIEETIKKVGRIIEVPNGEEPTVATVSDIEKLKDKPFFQTAQNGDKVIVYSQAKKAILYRPSTDKVVEMAPVNVPETASQQPAVAGATTQAPVPTETPAPTAVPAPAVPAKLIIYNGTLVAGLAADVEAKTGELNTDVTVVQTGNAAKRNYANTVIIVANPAYTDTAEKLTRIVGGTIDVLPEGEKAGDADIIILIGQDYKKS